MSDPARKPVPHSFFGCELVPEIVHKSPGKGVLMHGDAISVLKAIPSETVDLIVFDPAYESLERHRRQGTTTRLKQSKASSNQWFDCFPNRGYPELFKQISRVLKPGSHLYMFADEETRDIICTGYAPQTATSWFAVPPLENAGLKY